MDPPPATEGAPSRRSILRAATGLAALVLGCLVVALWLGDPGGDASDATAADDELTTGEPAPPPPERATPTTAAPATTAATSPPVTLGPSGTYVVAPGGTTPAGTGPLRTYRVEVEASTGVDPAGFAAAVDAALADPRGWTADGSVAFQRVPEGGDFRIVLATPATTDALCAPLRTNGIFSCEQGGDAILNLDRWVWGVEHWSTGIDSYRQMLVNHEVGHVLGHGHRSCPAPGAPAPVMQQQTKRLDGCVENAWPFP